MFMFKLIASSLIAASFLAAPAAFAEDPKMPRQLSLSGHGEVKAAPDMAVVELGTLSQAATAKAALEANTAKMTALIAMLKGAGVDDKDIQTSNFSVGPRYENSTTSSGNPKIAGYDVSNSVSVIVHKLGDLGGILDKAVAAGSNQINGITLTVADPQTALDDARKSAVKDALRKAAILTDAAGVKLGPLVNMSESGNQVPMPMARGRVVMDMAAKASAPVPVTEGQVAISADVNMVWEMQ
jgi:uncharacterized protein YggE